MADETAVLLIDMQERFVCMLWRHTRRRLVKAQIELLQHCARENVPLFVLQYIGDGDVIEELWEAIENVPRAQFITKNWDDGFNETNLGGYLEELRVKSLVLTGVNASFCVKKTAQTAVRLGYKIATASSLIANYAMLQNLFFQDDYQLHRRWYKRNGVFHTEEVPPERLFLT